MDEIWVILPRMIRLILTVIAILARALFRSRRELIAENLALRQQLALFKQKQPRPKLRPADRVFWVLLHQGWRNWINGLIIADPDFLCSTAGLEVVEPLEPTTTVNKPHVLGRFSTGST